jgi:hypothetical protein
MLSWLWTSAKPLLTGASDVFFDTPKRKDRYVSSVCVAFQLGEASYALVAGSCASTAEEGFEGCADAFLPYDDDKSYLIGNAVDGVWDSSTWGQDFAIIKLRDYVACQHWHVNRIPIIDVMSSVQLMEMGTTPTLAVAGFPIFELLDVSIVRNPDVDKGNRALGASLRAGFRMILRRRAIDYVPICGDPVTLVVEEDKHILVGMIVSHLYKVHDTYIAQGLDWFLRSKWYAVLNQKS